MPSIQPAAARERPHRRGPAPPLRAVAGRDDLLEAALARVPAREREALELADRDGLDAAQVAAVMGWTHAATRARLRDARRRLARAVADLSG